MASFGEALVGAFNQTYGTISTARLRDAQARAINDETDSAQRQRRDVEESQRRNGILNPDGTTNDPAATPRAPLAAPTAAAPPRADLGAPTSPAPAAPAPATGTPAPAPSPAPAASPQPGAAPAPAQQGAVAGAAPAGPQGPRPLVTPEQVQEAASIVERGGNNPVDAMVVAGGIAPQPQRTPGSPQSQQAAQFAPQLVQEITQNRGEGETGPLTRANWNAYLRDVTLAAQRNLNPREQVNALAVVDRIRVAGLQRFTALAVAAAQAGDMQGAANALNGASNFNPDGFQDTFQAVQGGVQMVRRPEAGERGQEQRVNVNADQLVRFATTMLNPTWSLEHFLNVRRQDETERHNRVGEGLQAASIAGAAADRAERRSERASNDRNDAAVIRAQRDLESARTEYDSLSRAESRDPGALAQARLRVESARQALDAAEERGGARALNMSGALEERAASRRQRAAEGEDRRAQTSPADITAFRNATDEIADAGARDWARANGRAYLSGSQGVDASAVPGILARAYAAMTPAQRSSPPSRIVDSLTGVTLTTPPRAGSQPQRGGGNGGTNPSAQQDQGGGGSSMGGARSTRPSTTAQEVPSSPEIAAVERHLGVSRAPAPTRSNVPPAQRAAGEVRALVDNGMGRDAAIAEVMRSGRYQGVSRRELESVVGQGGGRPSNLFPR